MKTTAILRSLFACALLAIGLLASGAARAGDDDVGCVDTAWKLIGANHKVCISSFRDPLIPGVVCHLSQAKTGGISGSLGLAQDQSEFSLSCVQVGEIPADLKIPQKADVFSEKTSIFFKSTHVTRFYDRDNNALVYLAVSTKLIDGSPRNSVSNVGINPWTASRH